MFFSQGLLQSAQSPVVRSRFCQSGGLSCPAVRWIKTREAYRWMRESECYRSDFWLRSVGFLVNVFVLGLYQVHEWAQVFEISEGELCPCALVHLISHSPVQGLIFDDPDSCSRVCVESRVDLLASGV